MKYSTLLLSAISLTLIACQSGPTVVKADPAQRKDLLSRVSALEGRWQAPGPDGNMSYTEFVVTSGGSAVREIMMPGNPYEMTNMYTLDGNSLHMTHYCAAGNQPHMRATAMADGRLAFVSEGVSDLKSKDELYMASMTLVFVDKDHVEEHWSALKSGKVAEEMVIKMERVK